MEAAVRRVGTLLYLVEPNATTFQHEDQVPDYVDEALPIFVTIALLEFGVQWLLGRPERLNEALSNLGIGILHEATRLVVSGLVLVGYEWLYQYRVWDLPWDSLYTWLAALVLVDFCYYWIHRANHGANKWCLDKNYASVFVIWDLLFGTFQLEKEDSEIVYGLTQQPQTHNALWYQFYYFGEMFRKVRSMTSWTDSLKAVFYGPGWNPGTPRLGDPDLFPEVTAPRTKYDPQVPLWKLLYIGSHLAVAVLMQQQLLARFLTVSWVTVVTSLTFIFVSVAVVTAMLDGWQWAGQAEAVRCTAYVLNACSSLTTHSPVLDSTLTLYFMVCALFWTCCSLARGLSSGKKDKLLLNNVN